MKFFNSDKSGFLSFVAKRMKALFALLFIIAGVQTLSAALVKGSWDGWQNHDLIQVADNEYYVDIEMTNADTDEFGIDFNGNFYSLSDYTITNWCSRQKFYTNNRNCNFTHNSGTYRFRVWDDGNEKTLTITGIIVTIDQPVQNADGTYTITGRFTNANTSQQQPQFYHIVFTERDGVIGENETATVSGDGSSFSFTKSFTPGVDYTCFARVIDNTSVENNDSESITFTPVKDMYITGDGSSDNWVCGKNWSPNECPLTYNSDDDVYIYTTTIETAGTYQFKITNGTWDETYGYTNVDYENSYSCSLGGNSGDNNVQFEVSAKSDVTIKFDRTTSKITLVVNTSCQDLKNGFTISGRFNANDGSPWQGPAVDTSDNNSDEDDGVFADDHRTITLTANNVAADSFEWQCVGYKIDDNPVETENIPTIAWTDNDKTSAQAKLSLPGTYTFECKATSNGVEFTSKPLTITAPAPEIGFDGPIIDGSWQSHSVAGNAEHKFERNKGSLVWSRDFTYNNGGGNDANSFVIIQRYKRGCIDSGSTDGWAGFTECEATNGNKGNKINSMEPENLTLSGLTQSEAYANFLANGDNWQTGVTQLTLTVTMESWNKYSISLAEAASCDITEGFVISGRLNASDEDDSVWKGTEVSSSVENALANDGEFADDHRTVTLSTAVDADSYEWTYQYYVDDKLYNSLSEENQIVWGEGGNTAKTVYATLNLPGKYVFTCKAECGVTTYSSGTVTIETYPVMGMDGPITTWGWENHSVAGSSGIMTRENGSLVWKKDFVCATNAGEGDNPYEFVVIQQYKNGCEENTGWAGHEECDLNGAKYNNKINDSGLNLTAGSVDFAPNHGTNFIPSSKPAAGSNLTLYVEMTGFDSYKVWLAVDVKLKSSVATEGEPEDLTKGGTLNVTSGGNAFEDGADLSEYVGQDFTISTNPKEGYKLKSITINGTTYTSSDDRVVTLTNAGLEVSAVFTLDCITPMEYTVTGGGIYCSNGGYATVNLSYSQSGINYTLYKGYNQPVEKSTQGGKGSPLSWNVSTDGTYTVKAIDAKETCSGQSPVIMSDRASVTSVSSVDITASPNSKISIYQPMTYTTTVPVVWSSSVVGDDALITMSQSETQWIVKAPKSNVDYTITATMKHPNENCQSAVTLKVDNVVPWVCDPGEAGLPTSTNGE